MLSTNLVTKTNTPAPQLTPSPRTFLDGMRMRRSAVERTPTGKYVVSILRAPGPPEVAEYQRRYSEIQSGLMPSDMSAVERRMGRLFLMFPVAGMSGDMLAAAILAYAGVLSSFPLWAVDAACQKIMKSGATFRPSAPEMRKLVDDECKPIYEEAEALNIILIAERYEEKPQDHRDRIKAGYGDLLADLASTNSAGRVQTPAEAKRDVKAGFAHLRNEALKVSPGLRKSNEAHFGAMRQSEEEAA